MTTYHRAIDAIRAADYLARTSGEAYAVIGTGDLLAVVPVDATDPADVLEVCRPFA
ncbi:hypothetical protein D3C76_48230 [compost metagenome]